MTQISQLHEKMADGRLGVQSRNGLQKDLQRLERKSTNTLPYNHKLSKSIPFSCNLANNS